jgi:HD-like signal output (HDOD) protein
MFDHSPLMGYVQQDLLGGDAVFPTSFQLSLAIKEALNRPDVHVAEVARLLEAEPLVAAKLVHMANCYTFNPLGRTVYGVEQAVKRVGFNVARSVAIAIAVDQIKLMPSMAPYADLAHASWRRSVHVAALLRELARLEATVPPDEAMLCGLVSELGVFYLLLRAASVPAYAHDRERLHDLLRQHSPAVCSPLLASLGVPQDIVVALDTEPAAGDSMAWQLQRLLAESRRLQALPDPAPVNEPRAEWLGDIRLEVDELRRAL